MKWDYFFGYNFVKYLEVYKKVKYPDGLNKVYFLGGGSQGQQ